MIKTELLHKYNMPTIEKFHHSTRDFYWTFLCQTDFIPAKVMEAQLLGESIGEYQEIIEARRFAREQINAIDEGSYDGPEAGTDIDVYYPPELEEDREE